MQIFEKIYSFKYCQYHLSVNAIKEGISLITFLPYRGRMKYNNKA